MLDKLLQYTPLGVLAIGLAVLVFGLLPGPVNNVAFVREYYGCNRPTKDVRETDIFCKDPGAAPQAKRDSNDFYVVVGGAIVLLSGLVFGVSMILKGRKEDPDESHSDGFGRPNQGF